MTTRATFNAEQWTVIANAPYLAAMLIMSSHRGGTLKETLAVSRAYASAREFYTDRLLQDVMSTPPAMNPASTPRGPEEVRREALDHLRRAVALLGRAATEEELNRYKRFVFYVAETVARAHREGGFLGLGGQEVSEAEQAALDEIAALFDEPSGPGDGDRGVGG
jgi:hypothetical protein